ncbi:MAG TPA: CoA transferase [Gaiellaceae bacterium]|jgi:crotonobetainyl-CoA:carnitine CoA-transferase CaiB-like acyl-CoA transferase|nr:CoA transferase [Gaiellaceae bacterium]
MLEGYTALDLTGAAGQLAGKLLAELGMRVLKAEPPEGDAVRRLGPFKDGVPHPDGSLRFAFLNGGKESFVGDVVEAATRVDVVLESGSVDVAGLRAANPGLVVCSITGFGLTGPRAGWLAPDIVVQAMGGLMYISGEPSLAPVQAPDAQGFGFGSVAAALGVVAALRRRELTGHGDHVDVSLQEALATQEHLIREFAQGGASIRRDGSQHKHVAPGRIFPCRDGHVFLFISSIHWKRFLELWSEHPAEFESDEWASAGYRRENHAVVDEAVEQFTRRFRKLEFSELMQEGGIPCLPVYAPSEFMADPHVALRGSFGPVEHSHLGSYVAPRLPVTIDGERVPAAAPPRLGANRGEPARHRPVGGGSVAMPLEGVRVVSLTTGIAGPNAARLMANLGADVIKVESRAGGIDTFRFFGSDLDSSPRFLETNLDVRSVTLNLKHPEGVGLLRELVAGSDVVLENFRPDVLPRLGLDDESLAALRPGLIVARMPGLGSSGPRALYGTWGPTLAAFSGLTYLWNHPGQAEPVGSQGVYPDYLAAVLVPLVVTAALLRRDRSGGGALLDFAQVEAAAYMLGTSYLETAINGADPLPAGNADPALPLHGCFACRGEDRWCAIACEDEAQWLRLCGLAGIAPETEDRDSAVSAWAGTLDAHEAMNRLQAVGVPAGVVQSGEDLAADPHLEARGFVQSVTHPTLGEVRMAGLPLRFADARTRPYGGAPALGEHNEEIVCGLLGHSLDELAAWQAAGVVH